MRSGSPDCWKAERAKGALRSKKRELELALEGSFTGNQRWLLKEELNQVEWLETKVQVLEQEIERRVAGAGEIKTRSTREPSRNE